MKKRITVCYFVCVASVFFCLTGLLTSCSQGGSDEKALERRQTVEEVKDLNEQSTRMDEGTLQSPNGNRRIDGLDGKEVRDEKDSGHNAKADGLDGLRVR